LNFWFFKINKRKKMQMHTNLNVLWLVIYDHLLKIIFLTRKIAAVNLCRFCKIGIKWSGRYCDQKFVFSSVIFRDLWASNCKYENNVREEFGGQISIILYVWVHNTRSGRYKANIFSPKIGLLEHSIRAYTPPPPPCCSSGVTREITFSEREVFFLS